MIHTFKTEQTGIGFEFDIVLEEDKQVYCFIGKNGIGKTRLLENMAKSLIYSHSIFQRNDNKAKNKIIYRYANLFMQKNIYDKLKEESLSLPLNIDINNITVKDKNKQTWGHTTFEHIGNNQNKSFICDKPLVFIGAKDRGFTRNINTENIKILDNAQGRVANSIKRTMSYINGEGLEHEEIANWFVSRLIVNPNFVVADQNKTNEVVTVLKLIEKLEPSYKLVIPRDEGGNSLAMLYHEGRLLLNNIPLEKLSTGFVSIIKIFQEIVAGYGGWENIENLTEIDGIVFIDEIEAHLHISWQTKILSILKDFFPKTTFYISTHSPLVLAGLKDGEAYEMYRENSFVKTKKISNIDNYFLNDILTEFFDVDLNSDKIQNVDKDKQNRAKELLLNLTKNLGEEK